ncbi:MAG: hypothetical protein Q9181_004477 [Wetmoreana brouardii]
MFAKATTIYLHDQDFAAKDGHLITTKQSWTRVQRGLVYFDAQQLFDAQLRKDCRDLLASITSSNKAITPAERQAHDDMQSLLSQHVASSQGDAAIAPLQSEEMIQVKLVVVSDWEQVFRQVIDLGEYQRVKDALMAPTLSAENIERFGHVLHLLSFKAMAGPTRKWTLLLRIRLCLISNNIRLDRLAGPKGRGTVKDINRWQIAGDHGANEYFRRTYTDGCVPPCADWALLAKFIAGCSVKLQYLASLAHDFYIKNKRRLSIFCDWLLSQWNVEFFLINLGLKLVNVRVTYANDEREAAQRLFNDPDEDIDILVTWSRISATTAELTFSTSSRSYESKSCNNRKPLRNVVGDDIGSTQQTSLVLSRLGFCDAASLRAMPIKSRISGDAESTAAGGHPAGGDEKDSDDDKKREELWTQAPEDKGDASNEESGDGGELYDPLPEP